jgi:Holliday junction resolvase
MNTSDANAEYKLVDRLWDEDWAVVRSAGSGTTQKDSCDIVAVKDGRTVFFEVKGVSEEKLPIAVSDDSSQLRELVERSLGESGGNIEAYFAIYVKQVGKWYYRHYRNTVIPEVVEMDKLYKVLI